VLFNSFEYFLFPPAVVILYFLLPYKCRNPFLLIASYFYMSWKWEPLIDAQKAKYDRSMFLIDSLAREHCPGAEIIDLVPEFSHRTELFFDPIHMNPEGQREVTRALSESLGAAPK
jgi:lysophospholipase L1-like esterase